MLVEKLPSAHGSGAEAPAGQYDPEASDRLDALDAPGLGDNCEKPETPIHLLENVMRGIRRYTMDVTLPHHERRRVHIQVPEGMGILLQFSKQCKLRDDDTIDIFNDSSCTTLLRSIRKPLLSITLPYNSIWMRFKRQTFRNTGNDSVVMFQVSPFSTKMKFAFWLILQMINGNLDGIEREEKIDVGEILRSYIS